MSTFLSNRDGGLTDEEGHYRFQTNVWDGEVIGDGLQVTQNSPLGMSVLVNGGDAKVPYLDYAYTVWIPDGSPEVATITTADPTNPRIDRVVLYVDRAETPQQVNPNNPSIPKIAVVAGTPGAVPSRPSDGTVDTAVSNNPWIDLADVLVGNGVTQITDANITDTRIPVTIAADKATDGAPVQFVDAYLNSSAAVSTVIPQDDTIPLNSEGTEILTVTITPKSATNTLKVRAKVFFGYGTASAVTAALFRGSTVNAIAAAGAADPSSNAMSCIPVEASVVAGSTSAITFRLRVGPTSDTMRYNGSGSRFFGDIPKTYLEVIEVKGS